MARRAFFSFFLQTTSSHIDSGQEFNHDRYMANGPEYAGSSGECGPFGTRAVSAAASVYVVEMLRVMADIARNPKEDGKVRVTAARTLCELAVKGPEMPAERLPTPVQPTPLADRRSQLQNEARSLRRAG